MVYEMFKEFKASPERCEMIASVESDAWVQFACAAMHDFGEAENVARAADNMMAEFRKRFIKPDDTPEDREADDDRSED